MRTILRELGWRYVLTIVIMGPNRISLELRLPLDI